MIHRLFASLTHTTSVHHNNMTLPKVIHGKDFSLGSRPSKEHRSQGNLIPPYTLLREALSLGTRRLWNNLTSNNSLGRDPTKLILTSLARSRGIQQIEERSIDFYLSIMSRSDKAYVPLMGATKNLQVIHHIGILDVSYTIQNRKSFLEGLISTPLVIPESNRKPSPTSNLV